MVSANLFLLQAFEEGHIVEALLGDNPYFIRDRIDPQSPDRDLIVKQLLHWADRPSRKQTAAEALERAVDVSLKRGDLRGALDILLCYDLSIRSTGTKLPLDVPKLVKSIHRWLVQNQETVVTAMAASDPDLLYFVRNMVASFPELGEGLAEVFPPQETNPTDRGGVAGAGEEGPGEETV